MASSSKLHLILCIISIFSIWVVADNGAGHHHAAPAPSVDCSSLVLKMADCLSYVSNGSTTTKPEGTCCSGFETVLKTDAVCLCEAFKSSSAQLGVVLNVTKALTLPGACKLHAPSAANCGSFVQSPPSSLPTFSPRRSPPSPVPVTSPTYLPRSPPTKLFVSAPTSPSPISASPFRPPPPFAGAPFPPSLLFLEESSDEPDDDDSPDVPPNSPNKKVGLIVGVSVGVLIFLFLAISFLSLMRWWKKRGAAEKDDRGVDLHMSMNRAEKTKDAVELDVIMEDDFEKGTGPRRFSYKDLVVATENFSELGKLGEGGFGAVYKGFLKYLNCYVAVKRVSTDSKQGIKEYASEVKIISQLRHRNLVKLIGWSHETEELLLVYEFMRNGSLDSHLFKDDSFLTWEVRYKIAQGLASGMLYLHEEWDQCVVHRDIKSSNVMLDSDFNAKLGDFGLARLMDHGQGPETTILAGTMGYMAPECVITGRASRESDVYSFGIVALEIACGRKPINHKASEDQLYLVQWVWDLYGKGNLLEAADPRLKGEFDKQQMECLMVIGLCCAHPETEFRPSIRQAIQVLNFEAPLPLLPSQMPVHTYFPPPPKSLLSLLSVELTAVQNHSSAYGNSIYSSQVTAISSDSSSSALLLHPH